MTQIFRQKPNVKMWNESRPIQHKPKNHLKIPHYILQEQGCCVEGIHSNGLMVTVFATCCMTMNRIITLIVNFLLKIKSVC